MLLFFLPASADLWAEWMDFNYGVHLILNGKVIFVIIIIFLSINVQDKLLSSFKHAQYLVECYAANVHCFGWRPVVLHWEECQSN